MHLFPSRLACLAFLALAATLPVHADSLASSASSAGSASVGSLSNSVRGSSNSSSGTTQTAEGDYRIVEVLALADRPGLLRLRLQHTERAGDDGELRLDLPQPTFARHGLAARDVVTLQVRPYGLAFARADTHEPFFLVLADDRLRELEARAL